MQKQLVIIRGLPGSGKSTLAKKLKEGTNASHYEADQYFMVDGIYQFNPEKLHIAHKVCANNVRIDLLFKPTSSSVGKTIDTVIVSNTFTTYKEVEQYLLLAAKCNAWVNMIHCQSKFKSIHNVPETSMERMRKRFVSNMEIIEEFRKNHSDEACANLEISHQSYSVVVK